MGPKLRCIRSTPTETESTRFSDFECFARTGVKSPLNAILLQTKTRYPQVSASLMVLSWLFLSPMEKRAPCISVSRSSTPNIFMPSGDTAYSSWTTPM